MSHNAIRVVVCGRKGQMGQIVTNCLKPEVEGKFHKSSKWESIEFVCSLLADKPGGPVIHFCNSAEGAQQDLPLLLAGKAPGNATVENVGSQDYSQPPVAVLTGMGIPSEEVDMLRQACEGIGNGIAWVTGGLSQAGVEDMIANNPPPPPEEYGPVTAGKMKKTLAKLREQGKLGVDGLYHWP